MAEEQQTELGVWVDQLLKDIFFQPDDELAKRAMLTGFSPQLKVNINGNHMTGDNYKKMILETRKTHDMEVLSNRELLASSRGDNESASSVAHISSFRLTEKKTGIAKIESSVTLITVDNEDGKRFLKELTEVYHAQE